MGRRKPATVHGMVLLDKPTGWTSHDVVARLRKHFGERRIGHTGTLDPGATGLLVLGVGNGTRLIRFIEDLDKSYECEIVFGSATDSLDDSGTTVATFDMAPVDPGRARSLVAAHLTGEVMQEPPMVSARHHEGKRLHQLAREGIEVHREARPVTVSGFDLAATDDPMVLAARITCSTGTYVRVLGADLGVLMGGGAHIRSLRRTRVGRWSVERASTLDDPVLSPMTEMVAHLASHVLDDAAIHDTRFGRVRERWSDEGPWVALDGAGEIVAVFEEWNHELAKPTVVFGGR